MSLPKFRPMFHRPRGLRRAGQSKRLLRLRKRESQRAVTAKAANGKHKTEEQQITKQRSGFFGTADGGAVGLINECKAAVARLFLKTSSDFAERGRIDFLEGPAGSPELVERTEKMIGIARDRFCHQRGLFVVAHSSGEFFGGDGKEQPEMFAQCKLQPDFAQQGFAQLRRRQKLYSD